MGCAPSIYLAGVAKVPYGVDELAVAGNIRKGAYRSDQMRNQRHSKCQRLRKLLSRENSF